jgi:hypothetical protein
MMPPGDHFFVMRTSETRKSENGLCSIAYSIISSRIPYQVLSSNLGMVPIVLVFRLPQAMPPACRISPEITMK